MSVLYFDECALAIMLVFIISALVHREYKSRTNLILFVMMLLIAVSAFADLSSGMLDNYVHGGTVPRIISYVSNYLYFFSHNAILPLYVLYIYSSVDIWHLFVANKNNIRVWNLLLIISWVFILMNGWAVNIFSISESVNYVRGPWSAALYVVAAIYGIWGFSVLIKYRKIINNDRFIVLTFLYVVVILGMLIQLLDSRLLVESFSISVAVLFFSVIVRREENQIDPISGALKYNEGVNILDKNFRTGKPVSIAFIRIINSNNISMYLGQENFSLFLRYVSKSLREIATKNSFQSTVFYLENGLYAFLGDTIDEDLIKNVTNECREMFSKDIHMDSYTVMAETRICVVFCPSDIHDVKQLLSLATTFHHTLPNDDEVHYFRDYKDEKNFKIRSKMPEIMANALLNDGFEMYYQPIYSIREKKFVAAEALIRLRDERYGYISPGLFIPVAEESGAIHDIGDFVINDVIKFISKVDFEKLGLKYIEINLSATQCIEVDLVDKIKGSLEDYQVDPSKLSLEITEAATDVNPEIVDQNIHKLHDFGIRIALDDYGTGYSNIRRVTTLPIDQVKLDKSFVDMIDEPQMLIVIKDTIAMLKEMGKEVLVEGIEDEAVARRFTELEADLIQGCELIQGFYFCKPIPKEEFIEFMIEHNI